MRYVLRTAWSLLTIAVGATVYPVRRTLESLSDSVLFYPGCGDVARFRGQLIVVCSCARVLMFVQNTSSARGLPKNNMARRLTSTPSSTDVQAEDDLPDSEHHPK